MAGCLHTERNHLLVETAKSTTHGGIVAGGPFALHADYMRNTVTKRNRSVVNWGHLWSALWWYEHFICLHGRRTC